MELLLATTNPGKVVEIAESLQGLSITLKTPKDFGIQTQPSEDGFSFEENATLKARYYFERSGIPTLADDSGIIVEALKNELGVHTRRWGAGPQASDKAWIEYFLKRMSKESNKRARFVCSIAIVLKKGHAQLFEGVCDGTITDCIEAPYLPGLPISSCFKPNGFSDVYSAMSIEQKNSSSHRGKALQKVREYLSEICR